MGDLELKTRNKILQLEVKIQELINLSKQGVLSRNMSMNHIGELLGECHVELKNLKESVEIDILIDASKIIS